MSTDLLSIAIETATCGHRNQKDRARRPYILHPLYVMMQMETEEEMIVAVLHDLLEDTDLTENTLNYYFPKNIVESIKLLTHLEEDSYDEYINKIVESRDLVAMKVKVADLEHNMDLSRLPIITDKDMERTDKYSESKFLITREISGRAYEKKTHSG
jgi:(p)ppGpp synthase/HD superfamily hydrolase